MKQSAANVLYDPPEGWRYGFPKVWPSFLQVTTGNIKRELERNGYPKRDSDFASRHCRFIGLDK